LRLRQIDVFGIEFGAAAAVELAALRPELVRRLVLSGISTAERLSQVKQRHRVVDVAGYGSDPFGADAVKLAHEIGAFLRGNN
jgi:pimeloyl-ACP methyl ester carboxylesterase